MKERKNQNQKIDYHVVIPTLILVAGIVFVLIVFPTASKNVIQILYDKTVEKWGWLYIVCCLASFVFVGWLTISPYGKLRLGGEDAKPAYRTLEWAGMIFTSGVGSSAVLLGFMEPLYYVNEPPFDMVPFSKEAYEYAHMYGQFHWGLSAWAVYIPAIVCIAMVVYQKGETSLRLSTITKYTKGKPKKIWGKLIDILVLFGILAGISTSLGLAIPVLSGLISDAFHIPNNFMLKVGILGIWILLFSMSVFRGLDKGIRILSNINLALLSIFLVIILLLGSVPQIMKMEINSIGLYIQEFVRMNTWLDPFGDGAFPKLWTIFYWGWWLTFMPMMALFVVRVSKGRTLRSVVWLQMLFGTLGCWLCFGVFGGYSLQVQQSGTLNLVKIIETEGQSQAMIQLLESMPGSFFITILFCVLMFVFLATTIDSAAYVLASSSMKYLKVDTQPSRGVRIFWAFVLATLSMGLLLLDELTAVQTIALLAGFPLIFVQFYLCKKGVYLLKEDFQLRHSDTK